jgi:CDP-6-deoxy-D-xylo-4-hexulose-3-dehydrase
MKIPYASKSINDKEKEALLEVIEDGHFTHSKFCNRFEKKLAELQGTKYSLMVNSGSSANLLAFMSLTQPELGDRQIKRGDEVITTACCFPTTVSPIINYGAIPVFVDVTIPEYNVDISQLEKALSRKTKAVILAHTMGFPFNVYEVQKFCKKHNLWLIADCCDALGARWGSKPIGSYGDISTFSFYPAHHITTGEGGACCTNSTQLNDIMLSLRDWGRECICISGKDNACGNRFGHGYDHKYIYSRFGFNLKATEFQGAMGCVQLDKLPDIRTKRLQNFVYFNSNFCEKYFLQPRFRNESLPSPFGYVITLRYDKAIDMQKHLESKGIQTRPLFAGNILKQPCSKNIEFRIIDKLTQSDRIFNQTLWFGIHPNLTEEEKEYIVQSVRSYFV